MQPISEFTKASFARPLTAGKELVYSTPTLLLRVVATLTALAIAGSSILDVISGQPGELPDAAAAQNQQRSLETPITLFRDANGTSPSDFKWRPVLDPDGLSFFEQPFSNPQPRQFSIGFKAKYIGPHAQGAVGGFTEPELYGIGTIYTPQIAEGHWSVPVTNENAKSYADRFAQAAKRIKQEKVNFQTNPNF